MPSSSSDSRSEEDRSVLVREAGIGPTLGADDIAMKNTSTCTHGQALPGDAMFALRASPPSSEDTAKGEQN